MLTESGVIAAVCAELQRRGYEIRQQLSESQRGDDIIATKYAEPTRTIYVEAKGETSSKNASARYGKSFDSAQVRDHVANAFYKAALVLSRGIAERDVHCNRLTSH